MRARSIGMKTLMGQILTLLVFAGVLYAVFRLVWWMTH
jgi:hypothetical protein